MKQRRYTIYILGAQQSGKSSFFAGLGVLSDADCPSGVQLLCEGESLSFIRGLVTHLRQGVWPPGTTRPQSIDADLRFNHKDVAVKWLDYPGERFVQHFAEGEPELGDLPEELREGDFFLVALDPRVELAGNNAFQASPEYKDRVNALLGALSTFRRVRGNTRPLHLAILITKADLVGRPLEKRRKWEKLLKERAPSFLENLREQFPKANIFAVSAVGNTIQGEGGILLPDSQNLVPWGYSNIFDWVVAEVKKEKSRPQHRMAIAVLLLVGTVVGGALLWRWYQEDMSLAFLQETRQLDLTEEQRRDRIEAIRQVSTRDRETEIDRLIEESKGILDQPGMSRTELQRAIEMFGQARQGGLGYRAVELDQLERAAQAAMEEKGYEAIKNAFEANASDFVPRALDFVGDYANSRFKDEVEEMLARHKQGVRERDVVALLGYSFAVMPLVDVPGY